MIEKLKHLLGNFRVFVNEFRLAFIYLTADICGSQVTGKGVPRRQTGPYILIAKV